jgi:ATP synthase F1 gamma subunit
MTTREISSLIEQGTSLKLIAQAYTELASIRLKKIRDDTERNRQFFDDLTYVYGIVKKVAKKRGISPNPKPKKRISVLLTSNYRFYGNINNELVKFFMVGNAKYPSDKLVIGETGRNYLNGIRYFHQVSTFILKKDFPDNEELKKLVAILEDYQQILIFYSRFKTVLTQEPTIKDITQTEDLSSEEQKGSENLAEFIFEPEIIKMLNFFDNQIKILLLEQTFLESELARTASRLISMDQAQGNAEIFIKKEKTELGQLKKSIDNIRLIEAFASLSKIKQETRKRA